ncbi:glycerol-3-phosphate 1-O-acyltransferase PlsY [bacterium]|nr:glycerol-3-phosphate 1-O-acyltransferase PlsY [bacterium]
MNLLLAMFGAYLIGSFPTAAVVAKRFGGVSIFEQGSGNPGTSNVYRVLGLRWALLVLSIDILKGYLPARLAGRFIDLIEKDPWFTEASEVMVVVGLGAILGHIYPIYTKFQGGKGVATTGGVLMSVAPYASVASLVTWLITLRWKRTFSLASLAAAIIFPFALYFFEGGRRFDVIGWGMIVPLLVILTHKSNLQRILQRDEFGMKNEKKEQ